MPIDARHGKNIPKGSALATAIAHVLRAEYRRVAARIRRGGEPGLSRTFQSQLASVTESVLATHYLTGKRIARKQVVLFRAEQTKSMGVSFSSEIATNETVEQAALQLAFDLAGSVSDTLRERMRDTMSSGLANGFSASEIAEAFEPFFGRYRAETIAVTEASRAQHAGEIETYREMGVQRKAWMASSDACDVCMGLDGSEMGLDGAFHVHEGGRESYRVVKHPPLHPVCKCTIVPVFS
jgi:SPP1 gp7 family putative phage head morphogenesis protein